jgi:RNA polymerase sigma-70 factor (ECF subfamily)
MSKFIYKKGELLDIISLAQKGDVKALEELIKRVQKQIFSIFSHLTSKKEDISDLTQETLLKMARSITALKNLKKFKSWLDQIITNVFYDYTRKKGENIIQISEKEFKELKDNLGCEPGEKCFFAELEKIINTAIMTLPLDFRITLVLREYEGLSYSDIAEITKTTIGTVKSRIARARNKLQQELKEFI